MTYDDRDRPKHLENYDDVKDRIPLFYEQFPEGRITTEIISEDSTGVTIKAYLWKNAEEQAMNAPLATGLARDVPGGRIEKYTENGETSAIGRALANYNVIGARGMKSHERPSAEEMESAYSMREMKANSSSPSAPEPSAPAQSGEVASVKQINFLQKLGYQKDPTGLTKREASSLISELQEEQDQLSTSRR